MRGLIYWAICEARLHRIILGTTTLGRREIVPQRNAEPPVDANVGPTSGSIIAALKDPRAILAYGLYGAAVVAVSNFGIPLVWAFGGATALFVVYLAFSLVPRVLRFFEQKQATDRFYDLEEKKIAARAKRSNPKG